MNLINYVLATVITYLGLFVGFFLAIIAEEELKQGKKYFILMKRALFLLLGVILVYYNVGNIFLYVVLAFFILFALSKKHNNAILYTGLAVFLFLGINNTNLFILVSSLIFIIGLPVGTLITHHLIKKTKSEIVKKIFVSHIHYIIIALVLYLLREMIFKVV